MNHITKVEPYDGSGWNSVAEQYFGEFLRFLKRATEKLEIFIEQPESAHGMANLAEAMNDCDYMFDIMSTETDEQFFSHHMMRRLTAVFGIFKGFYYDARDDHHNADYSTGRYFEKSIRGLHGLIEEWEQIVEYAEGQQ